MPLLWRSSRESRSERCITGAATSDPYLPPSLFRSRRRGNCRGPSGPNPVRAEPPK